MTRLALTSSFAAALASLAACGGGGGGSEPTTPANQAPTVAIDTPAANASFAAGASIRITASAADRDGTVARVEFYDGTQKLGEDTSAPFEFVWTNPTAGAHTINVRAVDNAGATALSASLPVSVAASTPSPSPPPPPANQAPTVTITSPAANFKPNAPATLTLVANAADADGSIARVDFYRVNPAAPVFDASTLLGQASAVGTPATYQLATAALAAGSYTFVARATDNAGALGTSASVPVTVNALPSIAITAPAAGASILIGSAVTLRASATDADGGVTKVEFFLNGSTTALGTATRVVTAGVPTNDYTLTWTAPTQGAYSFTARATDNDGATQSTASVAVNVAANALPTVTLDDPVAGNNAPTNLTLTAAASDGDGSITSVQFFNGAALLGNGVFDAASSKYRLVIPIPANQPSTTYTVTARATDNLGGQRTTASKSKTIAANAPPAVAMSSPASFTLPGTVVLTATASDSDGIAKVEFFEGTNKLGESSAAPYQFTWGSAAAGSYTLTARATDSVGTVATSAAQSVTVASDALTMACADGALTQCSGPSVLRVENGIGLTRSGVQAYGRSTSDLLAVNPTPSTAKGYELQTGGVAELRVRKDASGTAATVALLLSNLGLSWNTLTPRPQIVETFDPTAGRVQLDANGALVALALPASTNLGFYDFATQGTGATMANYANNRYFPRALAIRCVAGGTCPSAETSGPALTLGDWKAGGFDPDLLSATRFHEDGDIHAGNGLPDANGNPTWLVGGSGFGVPMPGSKGVREIRHWSYRYANLATWFTQDTVNISEWGGLDEHSKNRRGVVAYGDVTAPASVPTSGTVTYLGAVHGIYTADGSTDPAGVVGLVSVSIDFAARTVSVTLTNMVLEEAPGTAVPLGLTSTVALRASGEANHFNGTAATGVAATALGGGLGGRLFGPVGAGSSGNGPLEIGATLSLSNSTSRAVFVGGFVARRQ